MKTPDWIRNSSICKTCKQFCNGGSVLCDCCQEKEDQL